MSVFTFFTAVKVPFPKYLDLSPSLSSKASCTHVLAPDGTIALPKLQSAKVNSTSTVGFHLLSNTSLAYTLLISAISFFYNLKSIS
jgi:hypothetical protein